MAEKLSKKEKEFERLKAAFFEDPSTDPVKGTNVRYNMNPYKALVAIYGDPYEHKPREKTPGKKTPPKKTSEEETPKKKSKKDDDEEEEVPKKKKSKKDDDEEEVPKKKNSKKDDDDDEEVPKKKKSKKDDDDDDEEVPKKKKSKKDDDEEVPKKKKSKKDNDEEVPKKKKSKKDDDEEVPKKKKSKKDDEEDSDKDIVKLRKLLKSSTVESFHVKEVECHDLLFTFEITLTTDKGQFDATVRIDQELLEDMIVLFRPEFGNVLRRHLLKQLKSDIEENESMSNIVYNK